MNKNDILLCGLIFGVSLMILIPFYIFKTKGNKVAKVFYDSKLVLTIDLTVSDTAMYTVKGYNGDVLIKREDGKVMVVLENSPLHLCSTQGFIKESYESIVCLPNKVVIKIVALDGLDAVLK